MVVGTWVEGEFGDGIMWGWWAGMNDGERCVGLTIWRVFGGLRCVTVLRVLVCACRLRL